MAHRIFRISGLVTNCIKNNNVRNNVAAVTLLKPHEILTQNARSTSFYCKLPANSLWKSVTSVSNAGKRRGRGKGTPRIKDLNKGQKIGIGKIAMLFPGLNAPVIQGDHILERNRLPDDPNREQHLQQLQSSVHVRRRMKLHPLERGWSGGIMGGRKLGPPDPIDDEPFTDFESWILYFNHSSVMSSNMGRVNRSTAIVVTGNANGLAGFASAAAQEGKACIKTAKNKAGKRLMYIERYENHTVLHDFFTQFGSTKIFVKQKPKGYGLVCHRVIKTICEAVGITNLYAKVEGSKNVPHIIKAFFIGLLRQKTHQQMANEKKLHLVEFQGETGVFPKVLASPDRARKSEEIGTNETLNFVQYAMEGRIVLNKKKPPPFYTRLPSYAIHLRKTERKRDQDKVRIRLRAEYGDICSFLTEKYPEARVSKWRKHEKKEEVA